jgi:hypothetical protein
LPSAEAKELCALLYLGRDGLAGIPLNEVIEIQRSEVESKSCQEITQELMADVSLADELYAGLRLLELSCN